MLTLSEPASSTAQTLPVIQIGMHDFYSDLDLDSLSVKASFSIAGRSARRELSDLFRYIGDQVWRLNLPTDTLIPRNASLTISVKDNSGNLVSITRSFSNDNDENSPVSDDEIAFPVKARNSEIVIMIS